MSEPTTCGTLSQIVRKGEYRVKPTTRYNVLIGKLIAKKGVQALISQGYRIRKRLYVPPLIWVVGTCGVNNAGQTWIYENGQSDIEISSWVLADSIETKRVIRHEFAHTIKEYAMLKGSSHGKGFTTALKAVSSQRWRADRHWSPTPAIDEARKQIHPRIFV